jgi:hypothetical protein
MLGVLVAMVRHRLGREASPRAPQRADALPCWARAEAGHGRVDASRASSFFGGDWRFPRGNRWALDSISIADDEVLVCLRPLAVSGRDLNLDYPGHTRTEGGKPQAPPRFLGVGPSHFYNRYMPSSNPPPPSQPPASGPPASQPPASGPAPASADTINQALAAVKTTFPPDSSNLSDLQLTASDDTTASLTIVLNDPAPTTAGMWPIVDAIWDQFNTLNIPQATVISFCWSSDPSTTYAVDDLAHDWTFVSGDGSDGSSS